MPVTVVDAVLHPSDAAQSFVYCKSPIGLLEIGAAPAAVTSVNFVEKQRREPAGTPLLNEAVSQVSAYFQGTLRTFDLPIALNGTEFQCAVWRQLLKIGYGRTAAYRDIAAGIGIKLKAELDRKIKNVPLDPKGIHSCLTNLVSNAIDACQMSDKEDRSVTIRTKFEKGNIIFQVEDNGAGIEYDIKQKIFTTFFTTKGGLGTGLGLLTTRKIVQEHGGKISVISRKDEGSKFTMTFPRKRLFSLYNGKDE